MIQEGDRAPDFALKDANGKLWTLADFSGETFVLYFYPKDNTPGCTKEACSFRDQYSEFKKRGIDVVGVSADSEKSHQTFAEKQHLPFVLLSDPEKKTIADYGAYGEKKLYGKTYMGILRCTFIIGGDGIVKKVFPKVSPAGHAEEILVAL
ncbi:MAG: thioredoxin-dependent thiol peroxidase [Rectinema sp.]